MVATVDPRKFYGNNLSPPRSNSNTKPKYETVDLPSPLLHPFRSTGGLNIKRHRLQGRIEGKIKKLRTYSDDEIETPPTMKRYSSASESHSPPPAPVAVKRRKIFNLNNDGEINVSDLESMPIKKLGNDFDKVYSEKKGGSPVASRTRSSKIKKLRVRTQNNSTPPAMKRCSSGSEIHSPPPAPVAIKRRRIFNLTDAGELVGDVESMPIKNLWKDFDDVSEEKKVQKLVASKGVLKVNKGRFQIKTRSSPRFSC